MSPPPPQITESDLENILTAAHRLARQRELCEHTAESVMAWILASSLVEAGLTCSAELPETWGLSL